MTHDEIAEVAFAVLEACRENGVNDPLRQAHAIAVALKLAEPDAATHRDHDTHRKAEG